MTAALIQNAAALVLLVFLCFIFSGIGLLIRRIIPATFSSPGETLFFSFGTGTTVTGYAVFILASGQLLYPSALYALLALLLSSAVAGWRHAGISLSLNDLRPRGIVESVAATL